jgi:hypothetical protein
MRENMREYKSVFMTISVMMAGGLAGTFARESGMASAHAILSSCAHDTAITIKVQVFSQARQFGRQQSVVKFSFCQ